MSQCGGFVGNNPPRPCLLDAFHEGGHRALPQSQIDDSDTETETAAPAAVIVVEDNDDYVPPTQVPATLLDSWLLAGPGLVAVRQVYVWDDGLLSWSVDRG